MALITHYIKLKNDIQRWLKQDEHTDARFTTMFDFYAIPHDFPGYAESHKQTDLKARIEHLESCFRALVWKATLESVFGKRALGNLDNAPGRIVGTIASPFKDRR